MTDLPLYDEDDLPEPRRHLYNELDDEHEQAPTVYERNPSTLLP
jgi:hypothetical protein